MPIYEYVCEACTHTFEKLITSSRKRVHCPKCESAKVTKQFSTFAFKGEFKFVGSGGGCSHCGGGSCSTCSH
jgi:putative FmdB family regulatory protein